jgi:uncharacterized protein involved in outer membrane biogenesis
MKIVAGVAIALVVVLIGVVVAIYTVDVNTLIAPVKDRVKAATGRDLTVRGGGSLSLSLNPKLVLSDVTLGNAPWAATPEMVTAERLELQVALLPLLSRRFELVELTLVRPVIALETDAKGQKNWEFAGTRPQAAGAPATPAGPGAAAVVGAGNVVITDGALTYRDGKSGDVTRVTIERFFVRARSANVPVAAEFRGKVDDVAVALEGTLGPIASLLEKRWPYPVSLKGEIQGRPTDVSAKVKAQDDVYTLDELDLKFGANAVTGDFAVVTGGPRPKFRFALRAPTLLAKDLPIAVKTAATAAAKPPAAASNAIFPDTPVDFAALRAFDADGSFATGKLVLADGRAIDNFRVVIALAGGRLDVPTLQGAMLGGSLAGSLNIDASRPNAAALTVRLNGNGLSLGALLAAAGKARDVRGGSSDLTVSIAMRGRSSREWASTVSGSVKLVVGPATLVNTKVNLDGSIERLFDAVNPFRTSDPSTDLVCAVIRLPFENGVARVDKSIGMETKKLGVSASGTLDLRNETLDFSFAPRVHKDIPIQIPNLAQLVRFAGPIMAPQVKVDAVGSAAAIASIGAAVGTGGLSALGQALLSSVETGGDGPCRVALGGAGTTSRAKETPGKAGAPAPIVDEIGKAIGRIFGR